MAALDDLFLHEQLLLLALHDEKGTMLAQSFHFGAAGAVLAELLLRGRIELTEPRRKKRFATVVNPASLGDPLLDRAVVDIRTARRPAPLSAWVRRIAGTRRLQHQVAERLRYRGILGKREGRFLLVFTHAVYPTLDPAPERELVARLRAAVLGEDQVEPRTAVVLALAHHLGLLRYVLTKEELKARKTRLKQLAALESCTDATRASVTAVQEAIAAAHVAVVVATAG